MTIDEIKTNSAAIRERIDRVDQLVSEIEQMRLLSIPEIGCLEYINGNRCGTVTGELLRDVLKRGITAAIEAREIEIVDLLRNVAAVEQ